MKNNFDQFEDDNMVQDPTNYKAGIFYFNPKDKRVMVPKRIAMMGWTLNFAIIYTWMLIFGLIAVVLVAKWLG